MPEDNLERPLIGIVSRFADQKGFDLIAEIACRAGRPGSALVVLGSGEPRYETLFRNLAAAYPDKFGVPASVTTTPWPIALRPGADMFLMPSQYEPCGLNQIYSLRYGTLPIVRATGGLDDTIDEGPDSSSGITPAWALLGAIRARSGCVYGTRTNWQAMMRQRHAQGFFLGASAAEYIRLTAACGD